MFYHQSTEVQLIWYALLTLQNTHLRALLFIGNRKLIVFLHKQI